VVSGTGRHAERPATFRDVLVVREFRAIYAASTLSWLGDYIARAAITALVFEATGSIPASAAAFAISYAPWLLGGSFLVSLAERHPYRSVMIWCDVARMIGMTAVALGVGLKVHVAVLLALVLICALFSPPFDAARSAILPTVLDGDRYVVAVGLHTATAQPAQVAGYVVGSAMAAVDPRLALLINAGTFAVSALLVRLRVGLREAALAPARRTHLFKETVDGFRLVFTSPALRAVVLVVLGGAAFVVVPEALAAAWAANLADGPGRGWAQGIIMGSVPLGSILGALSVSRLVPPSTRRRLLLPLAVAVPLALVPTLFNPRLYLLALLAGASGFAVGGLVPIANAQFVQALPNGYRARAFGVVQAGLHLVQGAAVLITGLLAHSFRLHQVVGVWSLGGVGLMLLLSLTWPSPRVFARAVASAAAANNGGGAVPDIVPVRPRRPSSVPHVGRHRAQASQPGTIES
jgi:MFS family permease